MAKKVRFFIRVSKKTNIAPIRLRFSNGRQFDVYAKTEEQINSKYWNNDKGEPRVLAEYSEKQRDKLIKRLEDIQQFVLSEYDKLSDKTIIDSSWLSIVIDRFYNPTKYIQKGTSLFSYIKYFIENSHKRINPRSGVPISYKMKREYSVTFDYLKLYAQQYGEPDFVDIDMEFYNNFTELLRDKGLQTNTVGKKIQTLKIFLNSATEDGINVYNKYKSRKFRVISEEVENIYLDVTELEQFYKFDLKYKPSLERVRDLFIVACWTGLRFSDLHQIAPERINNGILTLKQTKTGDSVWIPLYPIVQVILDKYNGKLPKPISNQKYNDYLKEAAKMAKLKAPFIKTIYKKGKKLEKMHEKHELITSHTARRSFCTNAYEMGIPSITIMAISGHKTEQAFLKYIKMDGKRHAEKMRDVWIERGMHLKAAN